MRKTFTMLATAAVLASGLATAAPASAEESRPYCRYSGLGLDKVEFVCTSGSRYSEYQAVVRCADGIRYSRWLPMGQWGVYRCNDARVAGWSWR